MEWDNDNIDRMVSYINLELSKGRTMIDIENNEFGVNERVIHKRLTRKGYKKVDHIYIKAIDVNTPPPLPKKIKENITKSNIKGNANNFSEEEVIQLRELLKFKAELLKILDLNKKGVTKSNIRSKRNETKSFRVDTGLYEEFKKKARKNNDKITELLNRFMEEYINN